MRAAMRARRPAPRGQSTVELALSLLIFVSAALVGIHFAEVGYLPIKVHEAAVAPLWDSTALRVHRMRVGPKQDIGDFTPFDTIADAVESNANGRYHDFDGRSSAVNGGDTSVTQVFTRIQNLLVGCERDDANRTIEFDIVRGGRPPLFSPVPGNFGQPVPGSEGGPNESVLEDVYENKGSILCGARAQLDALPTLPTHFLDQGSGGFFNTPQARRFTMTVCSIGRPVGGECKGRFGILLGDWGFADRELTEHCPLQVERPDVPCTENRAFYNAAKSVYDRNLGSVGHASSELAKHYTGSSPIDENGFFMSYRGEEDGYVETRTPDGEAVDMQARPYNTGSQEHKPAKRRASNRCFLGLAKC